MPKLNNFSLGIYGKNEESNGQVVMSHEEEYKIQIKNQSNRRSDVELFVDGSPVGTWRLNPYQTATLERPADVQRRFTFVKKESQEGGLLGGKKSDLGLITAVCKPEKQVLRKRLATASASSVSDGLEKISSRREESISAGGTVLGEHSDQEFGTASSIRYAPENEWATLHLRLVHGEPLKYQSLQKNETQVPPQA